MGGFVFDPIAHFKTGPFNQTDHIDPDRNPASAKGACHMYCLKWLSLINSTPTAQLRMEKLATENSTREVCVLFKCFADKWSLEGRDGADNGVAQHVGVTIGQRTTTNDEEVFDEILSETEGGLVYTMYFNAKDAHSIAFFFPKDKNAKVLVFDPNYGEYAVPRSSLAEWLKDFKKQKYGGSIKTHQMRPVTI